MSTHIEDALHTTVVGRPIERIEDLRLLRGLGQYVDDLTLDDVLYAAILRSNVPHGRLLSIDVTAARAMPGVRAVITAEDVSRALNGRIPTTPLRLATMPGLVPFEQPVIAHDKVRYVGEPIAIVLAKSVALAEDALDVIELDIESLDAVADRRRAMAGTTLLFETETSNVALTYTAAKGDAWAVDAPYVRKECFSVQRHSAVTLEGRGLLAQWNAKAGSITVWGAAKVPFNTRRQLARDLGLPESSVIMIETDVGGGFGVRGEYYPENFLIPFAARLVDCPVKWVEDRRENLLSSNHAREMDAEIELHCARDGTILALRGKAWVDMGAYLRSTAAVPVRNVAQFMSGPYRIPNIHIEASMVLTNKTPIGTYRAPGRFEADFFRERLFDMAATDLGINPVEFRRRNLVGKDEMPYPLATITPVEKKEELDSGDNQVTLDRCLAEIGWEKKRALQGQLVGGRYHGLSIGCFIEGGGAGPKENARLIVEPDGKVTIHVGSANVGQGLETVCLQIAADALELPMDRLNLLHGSTNLLDEGFGSFHSRSTVMGGSAIMDAAKNLKAAIRKAAARRFGCDAEDVSVEAMLAASYAGNRIELSELAGEGLTAEGTFASHHHTYAYGAAAAHVAVDPDTGHVEVLEYVTVEDLGRVINPLTAKGQVIGGSMQGLGGALLEHMVYDENGQFLTASLADYLMPSASDFSNVKAVVLANYPSPHNPLGAKGGGEGGTVPVGGVIANAVAAALKSFDINPRELPLSPYKVWQLLQGAAAAATVNGKPRA